MASVGEVTLRFGAEGDAGEEPLRFQARHINVLVGPNNAGKSLMLRELSGVEPRLGRRRGSRKPAYDETRIVASVDWNTALAASLRGQVLSVILNDKDCEWKDIPEQDWDKLAPALERSAPALNAIRNRLCSNLVDMVRLGMDAEIAKYLNSPQGLDWQQSSTMIIVVAIALLISSRQTADIELDESSSITRGSEEATTQKGLTRTQADALQDVLCASWAECCDVFRTLGIDVEGLDLNDLFDLTSLGALVVQKLREVPIMGPLITRDAAVLRLPAVSPEKVARFEKFYRVGSWALDAEPLTNLRKLMESMYTSCTWQDPEHRSKVSKAVLYLDGLARLEMTRSAPIKGYEDESEDEPPILTLLKAPERRSILRNLVRDAIGAHLAIDMATQAPHVLWRLSSEEPEGGLESSYTAEAAEFHGRADPLDKRSDGIHAFVGMLAAVMAKWTDIVYIDEPEAFLHPPLVRKLARQLSEIARQADWQFFIATHSADLLASCASAGAEVNIIRLTHHTDRSTARLLDSRALRELSLDPVLRSESTLSALFYEGAIICEAAADRVLYQEVNERLIRFAGDEEDGIESCVFLNAQNWQTVARMMDPLRRMGVAAAAVLDADALFNDEFANILKAAQVPLQLRQAWLDQRGRLRVSLAKAKHGASPTSDQVRSTKLKGETIAALGKNDKRALKSLLKNMAEYGVFLVPVGELEDWFSDLGLKRSSDKSKWLRHALDRLGVDPESDTYVRPGKGDIWGFLRDVVAWIVNPERDGTCLQPDLES